MRWHLNASTLRLTFLENCGMNLWLLLLGVVGLFTYIVLQRSVSNLTRTPVWLLWLVMMTPAFALMVWILIHGPNSPMPMGIMLLFFLLIFLVGVIYWWLVLLGRSGTPLPADPNLKAEEARIPTAEINPPIRPIDRDEEAALQSCFPWTVFYLQNVEYRPQAIICRGQLRSNPEVAYKTIQENIEDQFGDRFLVVFQEGLNSKPFFALVPNPQSKSSGTVETRPLHRPGLALGLLGVTLLTTMAAGVEMGMTTTPTQFFNWPSPVAAQPLFVTLLATLHAFFSGVWAMLLHLSQGLPYAVTLMAILGTHELAHYLTAQRYRIRATYPYFIPVPPAGIFPFGTFGAFIQMRSPVPHRKALFDVGIAGPLAGFIITLPVILWGFSQSTVIQLTPESSILNFDSFNPSASLLLALLSKLALGSQLTVESAIKLHPVAVAGCLGVIVTALNLMPVGQLDGGHIVHAMFGQRTGAMIGQVARLLVLGLGLVRPEYLLWAILLFFMPVIDEPALNDVSELDNRRDLWGLLSLVLLVIIVLPVPGAFTQFLFGT